MSRKLYATSLVLFAVSLALPAVIDPNRHLNLVEMWGWQAALLSVYAGVTLLLPSNIGYALAVVVIPFGWFRVALASTAVSLASMIYSGLALPPRQLDPIGFPGGRLGPGYYAWLAAGAVMFVASLPGSIASRRPRPS